MEQKAAARGAARVVATRLRQMLDRLVTFWGSPWARRIVLGLFVVQAVVLVFAVHSGIPPDEDNHINFIEYYANHTLSPIFSHQQPTYSLGDKTRELDYVYHYTMSLVYRVLPFSTTVKYDVIRLCTVGFALLTFVLLAKLLARVGLSAATITTGLAIVTNVPMVLMMSAAINNDVLVWLGMVLGMWLLVRLWQEPDIHDLLWLAVLSTIGGLVKRTLLPLGVLFAVLGLIVVIRHFARLWRQFKQFDWRIGLALFLLIISLGLFAERVGGNLLVYHNLTPRCEQVDGDEACTVFWVNVRANTLAHLPPETLLPAPVFAVRWFESSIDNVVDVQTQYWLHEVRPAAFLAPALGYLLVIGTGYGLYYELSRRKAGQAEAMSRWRQGLLLMSMYFMVVHMLVNYESYRDIKFFGIALNGRYILPSLLPLACLACFYWTKILRKYPRLLAALAIVAIVGVIAGSGLTMMLRNPQLFMPSQPITVSQQP